MNDPNKDNLNKQAQGSGSDTVSAAKISTGASVGTAGQPATPGAHAPQSATLASHTSKPLGGAQAGSQSNEDSKGSTMSAAGDMAKTAADKARQSAQSAGETVRQTTDQVQRQAGEAYQQASEWARDTYEQTSRQLDQASRRSLEQMGRARGEVERFIYENPVLVGVMGLAAGLLLGALLPRTRQEDRVFGRWADEVREQGMRYARDMTQRGREFVEEALEGEDRFDRRDSEWRGEGDEDRGGRRPGARYQNH
jgi:ElaB/YqjD/DUF883 family membrane-anchored ribosome-binding protein